VFGSNQKIDLPYTSILLDCPPRTEESQASTAWCGTVGLLVDATGGHRNGHGDRFDGSVSLRLIGCILSDKITCM
jgi:hypothetical protein